MYINCNSNQSRILIHINLIIMHNILTRSSRHTHTHSSRKTTLATSENMIKIRKQLLRVAIPWCFKMLAPCVEHIYASELCNQSSAISTLIWHQECRLDMIMRFPTLIHWFAEWRCNIEQNYNLHSFIYGFFLRHNVHSSSCIGFNSSNEIWLLEHLNRK